MHLFDAGASEALCGGFLPTYGASDEHSRRTQPQLEPVPAVTVQVKTAAKSRRLVSHEAPLGSQGLCASHCVLRSAPNGNYSAPSLQSVRDEVFINVFDEMVYESGVVSKTAAPSSAAVPQRGFSLLFVLLRMAARGGSRCRPGWRSTGWAPSRFLSAPFILNPG